jgi:hypothetical protein
MSAEIIAFPARRNPAAPPQSGADRLTRALHDLDAALSEQRASIAAWRASLAELKLTVSGLGNDMRRYAGALDRLHDGVAQVNGEARQLEAWADGVLRP